MARRVLCWFSHLDLEPRLFEFWVSLITEERPALERVLLQAELSAPRNTGVPYRTGVCTRLFLVQTYSVSVLSVLCRSWIGLKCWVGVASSWNLCSAIACTIGLIQSCHDGLWPIRNSRPRRLRSFTLIFMTCVVSGCWVGLWYRGSGLSTWSRCWEMRATRRNTSRWSL